MTDTGPTSGGPTPPPGSTPQGAPIPPTDPTLGYATPSTTAYQGPAPTKDECTMAMLAHLLSIVIGFLGPLIIWLIKKDQSPFVNDQGRESLNFQLTMLIGYIVGGLTVCIFIGGIILPAVWVVSVVFAIMAAIKANSGIAYRYPINIRFIK